MIYQHFKRCLTIHGTTEVKITRDQIREMVKRQLDERCQKGYKTHETRKTKKMFGRTYRNCVKAESEEPVEDETLEERAAIPMEDILRAEDIIKKHLEEMFDEIGREDLSQNFSTEILVEPIIQKYVNSRRAQRNPRFNKLTGRINRRSARP